VLEPFLIKPFFALILIAISCSLLGVYVLWKKLSYLGDALSHSILLGLIFGVIFQIDQILALVLFAFIFSFLVRCVLQNRYFSKDTIIMIASYFCVATAVIINDIWIKNFNFTSYIFGDVLTAGSREITDLAAISLFTIFFVIFSFKKILITNISDDLARVEGVKTEFWNSFFLVLLSLVIALSVQIVGIFLMTALLILPAAIARIFAVSAKQMMILSLVIGIIVSALSFKVASTYALTVSAVVIAIFVLTFVASLLLKKLFFNEKSQ